MSKPHSALAFAPAVAWLAMLVAGYVLIASLNLPGHLSNDSVIALAEGRSGQRIAWGPPMFGSILGFFDRIAPGTALYVLASLALLFGSWAAMGALRPRISWLGPLALLACTAAPQVLIYQAIVWKDVLFANLSVSAFIALAFAAGRWGSRAAWPALAWACVCLALGCLVRQNGAICVAAAAVVLAWTARGEGWRRSLGWGLAGLLTPLVLAAALDAATPVREAPGKPNMDKGVRLLQSYDIAAAVAADPARPLPILEARHPKATRILRREAPGAYSPERIDSLSGSPVLGPALGVLKSDALSAQWRELVLSDPAGYAERRLAMFRWVFLTPEIDRCLPIHIGVEGPPRLLGYLGIVPGFELQDRRLYNYTTWWLDTPAYSHLSYAALAAFVALFLLVRGGAADVAVAGLMAAALVFAASFAVISLACDYRYLYFLDLTAITGVLYVALDPSLRRRPAPRRARTAAPIGRRSRAWGSARR